MSENRMGHCFSFCSELVFVCFFFNFKITNWQVRIIYTQSIKYNYLVYILGYQSQSTSLTHPSQHMLSVRFFELLYN